MLHPCASQGGRRAFASAGHGMLMRNRTCSPNNVGFWGTGEIELCLHAAHNVQYQLIGVAVGPKRLL